MTITLKKISPQQPEARALIKELDDYQASLYPAESNHLDSIDALARDNVLFIGAYDGKVLVGCGAIKIIEGAYGEVKRLFVKSRYRGQNIAKAIMRRLEQHLIENDIALARLETGIHQTGAIALYERCGYLRRGPFGDYQADPLSLFMEKRLPV